MKRRFVYKLGVLSMLALMAFAGNTYAMMSSGGSTGTMGGTGGTGTTVEPGDRFVLRDDVNDADADLSDDVLIRPDNRSCFRL